MNYKKIIIGILILSVSCSENKMVSFDYSNPELGWDISVPEGWKKNDLRDAISNNEAGIKAMEEAIDKEMDLAAINYSLNFQKNNSNVFQSVYEPFEETEPGLWEKNNAKIKMLFANVYEDQGIVIDTSETSIENVGGLDFKRYSITMFDQEHVKLNQIFYSTYRNGYDFSVCLTFDSDKNKAELLEIWKSSKFN